ncbi:hypothetical protein CP_0830 [Chlamydia pneumoniae AR39]|uniref:Uncharacterized protein n=1 Tax=Chlamydia pneumoniae TaxID=83558 RepID=Q9K1X4_CHLPN|nr:hypothetical protein CP_0830 [Chlamydia pneumoniae AR39]ETR79810.1 hypothetical protein X556_0874 [Chlamydia pneumoniae B21]
MDFCFIFSFPLNRLQSNLQENDVLANFPFFSTHSNYKS